MGLPARALDNRPQTFRVLGPTAEDVYSRAEHDFIRCPLLCFVFSTAAAVGPRDYAQKGKVSGPIWDPSLCAESKHIPRENSDEQLPRNNFF